MSYRGRSDARRALAAYRASKLRARPKGPASVAVSAQSILKDMYPQHGSPTWSPCVLDAYRRHWVSLEQLQSVPKWGRIPGIYDLAYRNNPMFAMLRKPPSPLRQSLPTWRDSARHARGVR